MLSLYEILKASKTGIAPDMWTALAGMNWGGADSGHEIKELTGILPLSFTADGTPLLDYLISGNMSQTGTSTPTSPITPSECGERTRNLFDKDNVVFSGFYPHADTGAVVNTSSGKFLSIIVPCEPNTSYTWSFDRIVADLRNRVAGYSAFPTVGLACTFLDKEPDPQSGSTRAIQKFTTTANTHWLILMVTGTGQTAEMLTEDVAENAQLEIGTEMTSYEPYGYKLDISSANTTTPVYLGEVESTRRIKKLVLTGEENWQKYAQASDRWLYFLSITTAEVKNVVCSHCSYSGSIPDYTTIGVQVSSSLRSLLLNLGTVIGNNTETDFKAYLAQQYANGTPVTVWYVLATEETGIVNEPIRKIGDYADTVSYEQAGVQIPTLHGNTVIDVETELKPSEMYIKYQE